MLRTLGVSRTCYNSFKRKKSNKKTTRKEQIKQLIFEIHYKSRRIHGAPKVTQELRKQGLRIAQKTVGNYIREMGLKAHYIKKHKVPRTIPNIDLELKNFLNEQYNPEAPNAVWCSNITHIKTKEGFVYLTSIMDLFSRKIIAWRLSDTLEAKWVVECIEEAKRYRLVDKSLIMHTDRGCQYTSKDDLEALSKITASYSKKSESLAKCLYRIISCFNQKRMALQL